MSAARRTLRGVWLGRRSYQSVYALQVRLRDERARGQRADTVLLLEHEPVITIGRGGQAQNLLASEDFLASRGVELVRTDRGGDITLHAPGQLVAYPIIDLKPDRRDVRRYVHDLAEAMRCLVEPYDIHGGLVEGLVGLWVDRTSPNSWQGGEVAQDLAKLGAIGVRISHWVTLHGFALNLTIPLDFFDLIVPCGISRYGVTSVRQLTGLEPSCEAVAARALRVLSSTFGAEGGEIEDWSGLAVDKL